MMVTTSISYKENEKAEVEKIITEAIIDGYVIAKHEENKKHIGIYNVRLVKVS